MKYFFIIDMKECGRDKEASSSSQNAPGCPIVVTNPMSVSVPNLTCTEANNTLEPAAATGLLETFAAMARRRNLGLFSNCFAWFTLTLFQIKYFSFIKKKSKN